MSEKYILHQFLEKDIRVSLSLSILQAKKISWKFAEWSQHVHYTYTQCPSKVNATGQTSCNLNVTKYQCRQWQLISELPAERTSPQINASIMGVCAIAGSAEKKTWKEILAWISLFRENKESVFFTKTELSHIWSIKHSWYKYIFTKFLPLAYIFLIKDKDGLFLIKGLSSFWSTDFYMSLFLSTCPSTCLYITHHISGTIHHLVSIFATQMWNEYFKIFNFLS